MTSPVNQPESSEARNETILAMSDGVPIRPRGVMATRCFSMSLSTSYKPASFVPSLSVALGLTEFTRIYANFSRGEFFRQHARHGIESRFAGGVDGVARWMRTRGTGADIDYASAIRTEVPERFSDDQQRAEQVDDRVTRAVGRCRSECAFQRQPSGRGPKGYNTSSLAAVNP